MWLNQSQLVKGFVQTTFIYSDSVYGKNFIKAKKINIAHKL